jgi:AAA15 family ATPase/GTPase
MLLDFKVSNFRSIREEQVLSFIGAGDSEELPGNFVQPGLPGMGDSKVLKAIALYGANASGKTNILSALQFLADFAANSFLDRKPEAATGTEPFRLEPEWAERPSEFEVSAIIEGVRYTYGVALTTQRITEEYLVAFPDGKPETFFEREWDLERNETIWSFPTSAFTISDELRRSTRVNCTLLSSGSQFNHPQLTTVHRWLVTHLRVLAIGRGDELLKATARYWVESSAGIRGVLLALMRHADFGVTDLAIAKVPDEQLHKLATRLRGMKWNSAQEGFDISFSHQGRDGSVQLSFDEESTGTQRYFGLSGSVVKTLSQDFALAIDEIESSLHPLLVRAIVELFCDAGANPKGAQLLFTTHNPLLLDRTLIRPDQIWFTEKDNTGATALYPLTDYKERPEESLVNGYLAGRYGGIPFIPSGLLPK